MTENKNQTDNESSIQETVVAGEDATPLEEWQGELPPEDDFHDQGEFQDDLQEDIIDESMSTEAYDDQTDSTAKSGRGKTVVLVAVLGLGVALMGGLAYLQFGIGSDNKSVSPLVPVSSVLSMQDIKNQKFQPPTTPEETHPSTTETTASTDLTKLFSPNNPGAGEAKALPGGEMADPTAEKPSLNVTTDVVPLSAQMAPPALPAVDTKHTTTAAVPALDKEPKIAKVETLPLPAKVEHGVPPTVAGVEVDNRIKDLTGQVEKLTKSLDEVTQRNASLAAELEKLQQAKTKVESKPKTVVAEKEVMSIDEGTLPPDTAKTKAIETKKSQNPKAEKAVRAPKESPRKKKSVAQSPAWVLRAAMPNAAWVAMDANSTELRRVSVGETLPGLGKVKEIRQNGDKWEVVGSSSTLR